MALKILLADDSMTAQNMGKKILTDAGYEVVAVSNGAQAVKKVASEKPDLAVLDVFMPGYSGLEVCERIKKAQETAHIPVLLTVGKMEPFKSEEGTRVGADGLIVKPFEASDLLAAIKKIEEKLSVPAAEPEEDTQKVPVVEEFQDTSYEEWKVSAPPQVEEEEEKPVTQKFEVPHEMSATPAFGMDFEEPAAPDLPTRPTAAIEAPHADRTMAMDPSLMNRETAIIEPPAERSRATAEMPAPLQAGAGASAVHAPEEPPAKVALPPELAAAAAIPTIPEDDLAMTGHMKAMLEPEQKAAEHHEIEFTSAPKAVEVEHVPAPGFEPTVSQEAIHVETGRDPALVTDSAELSKFTTKFGVEGAEPITVGVASDMPELYADSQPAAEPAAASADSDFEARVAAAMAGYEEPVTQEMPASLVPEPVPAAAPAPSAFVPEPPAPEPVVPEPAAEPGQDTATFIAQMQEAVQNLPVDTTPHSEAAAEPVAVPAAAAVPVAENVPDHALAAAMAAAVGATVEPQVAAPVVQAAATAVAKGVDPQLIADVVHRVVERMKPDLAAEIAKELESILKK